MKSRRKNYDEDQERNRRGGKEGRFAQNTLYAYLKFSTINIHLKTAT